MSRLALALALVSATAFARAPSPKFEIRNNELVVPRAVVFETGTTKLARESAAALAHVAAYLAEKTYITTTRVEVHTDNAGRADASSKLGVGRSMAVAKALVEKGGDCKRLVAVGFGGDKPIAENRAKNRRTSFFNAALRGRAIGGMPLDGGGKDAGDVCK